MTEPLLSPPSSTSSNSEPKPRASASLQNLLSWAPLYLRSSARKSDRTITTLSSILSTPSGTDTLLLLLGYSSLLSSTVLTNISLTRLHTLALLTVRKVTQLPPGTVVVLDVKDARIKSDRLLVAAGKLKALSSVIGDFRIFVRLWGLLGIYSWGKGVWNSPPKDGSEAVLVRAQVAVNILFQVLENAAYLASKNVINLSEARQTKAWLWSSRFWAAHVGLEFLRLGRVYQMHVSQLQGTEEEKRKDGGKGDVWVKGGEEERRWWNEWKRSLLVNAAWAPLTVHWSLEQGLIGDFWVGVFGSVAGVVGVRRLLERVGEV